MWRGCGLNGGMTTFRHAASVQPGHVFRGARAASVQSDWHAMIWPCISYVGIGGGRLGSGPCALTECRRSRSHMTPVAGYLFAISANPHVAPAALPASRRVYEQPATSWACMQPCARQRKECLDRQAGEECGHKGRILPLIGGQSGPFRLPPDRLGSEALRCA